MIPWPLGESTLPLKVKVVTIIILTARKKILNTIIVKPEVIIHGNNLPNLFS
jgi:hypothetical protein